MPHFIASALRTPFHIDIAPTPLFSATCGVSARVSAFASLSWSSFISLPTAIDVPAIQHGRPRQSVVFIPLVVS
jgi:hypothetical protein